MNNLLKPVACGAVFGCLLVGGQTVLAHEAGDIMLRAGAATVVTDTDSSAISGLPDGVNNATVDVDNNTQLGLTLAYLFTDHIGLELLAATPFSHDVTGEGDISGVDVGSTKQLPPTLTLQYYFGDNSWRVNPYIGVGVNWTIYFDEEIDQGLINTLNTLPTIQSLGGIQSANLDIDNSVGLAGEIGCDIKLTDKWFVNAAVWYIDISADSTVTTNLGTRHEVNVDLNPWVFNFAIAYRF